MTDAFSKWLVTIESWIAAFCLLLMLLLSVFQLLIRNFLDIGFAEIDIINRHLLVICGMAGAILATSHMQHIKIDALVTILNKKIIAYLRIPVLLFSVIVCALMCDYSITFCKDEWTYAPANERWILPFTLVYPIGFALLTLHFLLLCRKQPAPDQNR